MRRIEWLYKWHQMEKPDVNGETSYGRSAPGFELIVGVRLGHTYWQIVTNDFEARVAEGTVDHCDRRILPSKSAAYWARVDCDAALTAIFDARRVAVENAKEEAEKPRARPC